VRLKLEKWYDMQPPRLVFGHGEIFAMQ
jgi:hypothetical protein